MRKFHLHEQAVGNKSSGEREEDENSGYDCQGLKQRDTKIRNIHRTSVQFQSEDKLETWWRAVILQ